MHYVRALYACPSVTVITCGSNSAKCADIEVSMSNIDWTHVHVVVWLHLHKELNIASHLTSQRVYCLHKSDTFPSTATHCRTIKINALIAWLGTLTPNRTTEQTNKRTIGKRLTQTTELAVTRPTQTTEQTNKRTTEQTNNLTKLPKSSTYLHQLKHYCELCYCSEEEVLSNEKQEFR